MNLKKKDLDILNVNYLEQSVANLQLSNCQKDIKIMELMVEKQKLEIQLKRTVANSLQEKVKFHKDELNEIIEKIKKTYKLDKFTGYDPDTGEIK